MKSSYVMDIIQEDCANASRQAELLEALRGETIFITGGTGFVGVWFCELVAHLNDQHGFGTQLLLLSGRAQSFSAKAPHLAMRKDVTLIERDVRSLLDIPKEASWIIHAAGSPDNRLAASDPLRVAQVITRGTETVLDAATRLPNLKKFLNISSGLVYGAQPLERERIPEGYSGGLDCASVSGIYAESKRFAETLCVAYRSQHRLPVVTARPFAFIGPYQLLDRPWAVNNFIRDGLLGGPIRILGDGQTVRSYMYPSDMVFWLLRILAAGIPGQSYNVGSPHGVTLQQLAEKVAACFPAPPKILSRLSPEQALHRSRFVPDVRLAEETLGLRLTVDLENALRRTILWNQAQNKLMRVEKAR
ncbi:MAG: NAD-dependent epimerase/dehydratase family protein [Candidatus Omnitrophica bacterium]|nr:NAD-dependent epimerase/dehydratase family protein [Candidatus Omnitrophota bacterium]